MTPQEFQDYLATPSPNLQDYAFYKAKKGDEISIFNTFANKRFECTFIKYEIIKLGTGILIPFGPANLKKAKKVVAVVKYINEYGIKMRWVMHEEGEAESIEVIN